MNSVRRAALSQADHNRYSTCAASVRHACLCCDGDSCCSSRYLLPAGPRWLRPPRSPSRFGSTPPEPNPRTAPASPGGGRSLCAGGLSSLFVRPTDGVALREPVGQPEEPGQSGHGERAAKTVRRMHDRSLARAARPLVRAVRSPPRPRIADPPLERALSTVSRVIHKRPLGRRDEGPGDAMVGARSADHVGDPRCPNPACLSS